MPEESAQRPGRKGIYLLPNLFTTAALFSGFYAIVAAMNGDFAPAAVAIFVAMVLDGLDGRVARMTNTQSPFGGEYDSLADVISFGLAPALVVYQWALIHLAGQGWFLSKLGWLAAFMFVASAALRLARFNVETGKADRRFFCGLASPAAAAVLMGMVWVGADMGVPGREMALAALALTVLTALLMVSSIPYYSFKDIDFRRSVPFITIFLVVLGFVLASIDPPKVLFTGALVYAASGPAIWVLRRLRRRRSAA